jgi:hypothetical protein
MKMGQATRIASHAQILVKIHKGQYFYKVVPANFVC